MSFFSDLAELEHAGTEYILATVVESQGSTPQKPGAKMAILAAGHTRGTIGGGAIEKQIVDAAVALLANPSQSTLLVDTHLTHDLGMCCGGRMRVFLEKRAPAWDVWIFGAGHVAKETAALAHFAGFAVHVADDRHEWADVARFPNATVHLQAPDDVARTLPSSSQRFACVMTHDHALDLACVEALVGKNLGYLGVIGSRRKSEKFRQRLLASGCAAELLAQLQSPMGIDICAQTPQEIALSIVAELVRRRRSGKGEP